MSSLMSKRYSEGGGGIFSGRGVGVWVGGGLGVQQHRSYIFLHAGGQANRYGAVTAGLSRTASISISGIPSL